MDGKKQPFVRYSYIALVGRPLVRLVANLVGGNEFVLEKSDRCAINRKFGWRSITVST